MNTSALESKISAFKLINMISDNMGKAFAPYCEAIVPIMTENINYQFSKQIRKYAFKTLTNMLFSIGEPNNITLFKTVLPIIVTMFEKNIER